MKNRAKCKLCHSIIESFHDSDYVPCKCGHISVSGGFKMECSAIDWHNFLRVDDLGNEIIVKVVQSLPESFSGNQIPTREDRLKILDEMISTYENLPKSALNTPITHYDLMSFMRVVSSIFRT